MMKRETLLSYKRTTLKYSGQLTYEGTQTLIASHLEALDTIDKLSALTQGWADLGVAATAEVERLRAENLELHRAVCTDFDCARCAE